jgi:GTP-binding protein
MSFIDKAKVSVLAGKGGDGKLSFRHEIYVAKGGPDGGDGGQGANVVLVASRNQNTLAAFRYSKELKADAGQNGGPSKMRGRSAKHMLVPVPVGTIATNTATGQVLADLTEDGQTAIIATGGKGGYGNAHFVSSRRQTPKFAEVGEPGEELEVSLELKMIADVGLVGLPNAGKSTLLSKISNARPEIADYAFTTLVPNLGVVDIDKGSSLLVADIPGLIEGAADGKGLGHAFLRHVERTAVILHLIDAYNEDVVAVYKTIRAELKAYGGGLADRPEVIALTKVEGLDDEMTDDLIKQLKKAAPKSTAIFAISAQSGQNVKTMLYKVKELVQIEREKIIVLEANNDLPIISLSEADMTDQWSVVKEDDGAFLVSGDKIEQFGRRTNYENEEGVQRLRHIMGKMGIMHDLVRKGVEADDTIRINRAGEFKY